MISTNAPATGALSPSVLLEALSDALERNTSAFGQDVSVAVGTGPQATPRWFVIVFSSTGQGYGQMQGVLPRSVSAALFLPADDGQRLVAGDATLLEATFQYFFGGQSPIGLRASLKGTP